MLLVFSVLLPPPPPAHCVTKVLCYEEGEEVWLSCFGWARSFPPLCPSTFSSSAAFKQKEERAYQLGTDFPPAAALMSRFYTAARKVDRFVPRLSTLFRPSVRPLARSLSCSNTTTTLRLYVQTSRNGSHTHTTLSSSFLFISFFYYFISSLLFFTFVCTAACCCVCVCTITLCCCSNHCFLLFLKQKEITTHQHATKKKLGAKKKLCTFVNVRVAV